MTKERLLAGIDAARAELTEIKIELAKGGDAAYVELGRQIGGLAIETMARLSCANDDLLFLKLAVLGTEHAPEIQDEARRYRDIWRERERGVTKADQ